MSVTHRTTGTWAELTADGTVAIPATPQAGDRMFLFARWKDFSVTATVANWTELTEFADGSTSSGNGTGSVKVGCWYRDWQSGDTDPTLDFSANPNNASVVIIVMSKSASDVWQTPLARTAAMTTWTTTSQSVSASANVALPSSSVVMGLIGIRDDTATMTRPTTGIDDVEGTVTWNGNYVESPVTHHSTTTGDDGAADLGYRLVTTGATVTLRMTGTISAAETGAALWVVQGVSVQVTAGAGTLSSSRFVPLLLLAVIPASTTLAAARFAPTAKLHVRLTPPATTLTTTTQAPTAQVRTNITPATRSVTLSSLSPALTLNRLITPPSGSLTITATRPHVLPYQITWLDPGGDAVQATGYFNVVEEGSVSYDTSQKVVGAGSWKFDSDDGSPGTAYVKVPDVLAPGGGDNARRVSFYWRYDSVPDETVTVTQFALGGFGGTSTVYSGGGFSNSTNFQSDNGVYATATPAKNAGQGTAFMLDLTGVGAITEAVIDSVKIIYERKYDTDTSVGISRVKWRVSGVEGPDHDNTDQPLTDTVVEVDVTGERGWTPPDFAIDTFEVIAEARRGDTDTSHTQSWDYVKVEVVFHLPIEIVSALTVGDARGFSIAVSPKGAGLVPVLVQRDALGNGQSYEGITQLLADTDYRISFAYTHHGSDDLDIKIYINSVEELSIEGIPTRGTGALPHLSYGWLVSPGADHLCWFDQLYIDKGDDLSDPGNMLMTAKLPASVNDNDWTTTGGTGAVDERPLNETNYKKHTTVSGTVRQTYTLQAAAVGDVDVSGESQAGYMAWAVVNDHFTAFGGGYIFLVVDGDDKGDGGPNSFLGDPPSLVPALIYYPTTTGTYPADAAGVGMALKNVEDPTSVSLYECGIVICYQGPDTDDPLFPLQLLQEDASASVSDDMGGTPPAEYELFNRILEVPGAVTTTTISRSTAPGEVPQQQAILENHGADERGIVVISPGIEVSNNIDVAGADAPVELRRVDQTVV